MIDRGDTESENYSLAGSKRFVLKKILLTAVLLIVLFFSMGLAVIYFEPQIRNGAFWMADHFGFVGMAGLLFLSDSVVSPLPPDVLLVVVANSSLRDHWFFYIPILGLVSTLGGCLGWWIGGHLGSSKWMKARLSQKEKVKQIVKNFGPWGVALGALTPIPFSITCWTAGLLKMKWQPFLLAALLRIPRFVIYYLVIHYSILVKDMI